jgi:hypothetical protein
MITPGMELAEDGAKIASIVSIEDFYGSLLGDSFESSGSGR